MLEGQLAKLIDRRWEARLFEKDGHIRVRRGRDSGMFQDGMGANREQPTLGWFSPSDGARSRY